MKDAREVLPWITSFWVAGFIFVRPLLTIGFVAVGMALYLFMWWIDES